METQKKLEDDIYFGINKNDFLKWLYKIHPDFFQNLKEMYLQNQDNY